MNYDSLLKVENVDEVTHLFSWNGQAFPIRAGQTSLVSFDALVVALGDPRSGPQPTAIIPEAGGVSIQIPARRDEIKRLNTYYGVYTEGVNDPSYLDGQEGVTLADRLPKVKVYSLDPEDGEDPIIFPCDDPTCDRFVQADGDKSQVGIMQRQLEAMRRKQAILEQMVKAQNGNAVAEELGSGTEVTEDTPQSTKRVIKAS